MAQHSLEHPIFNQGKQQSDVDLDNYQLSDKAEKVGFSQADLEYWTKFLVTRGIPITLAVSTVAGLILRFSK